MGDDKETGACVLEPTWYYFILVGVVTFFGGLVILIPSRIIWYLTHRDTGDSQPRHRKTGVAKLFGRVRASAVTLLSGHTPWSKFVVLFVFLLNMTSIVIYLFEATTFSREVCGEVRHDPVQLVYIALCLLFVIHYIVRFTASTDKLFFWLDIYSIVDHLTIGPTAYGFYMNTNWIGLRFLRILFLLQLPEVLQMLHIIKTSKHIRLAQIGTIFISIWMTSSGFVHLCENTGDPFADYKNGQTLGYWEAVYWLLVTMSTVGFGEIHPLTDMGRAFIVIYIIGTFAMFTAIVPELVTYLGKSTKYHRPYKRTFGKRHIIVCGHITYDSIAHFIHNFLHEDSENIGTDVVIIDSHKPDLEMEAFFKRHINDVTYLQGSVMDMVTLKNAKVSDAKACLILANRNSDNPDEEDASNIMRATSVKNYNPETRIIIQLLQYQNKTFLLHIPNWNWGRTNGDDVICIAELKLGLMAQNCLAPGVSTLMSNLFTMRSFKANGREIDWQQYYRVGAANEIYVETFSSAFVGLSFSQAVEICFSELGILLVAMQSSPVDPRARLRINPQSATIGIDTVGYFFAQSPEEVRIVTTYTPKGSDEKFKNGKLAKNGKHSNLRDVNLAILPEKEALTESSPGGDGIGQKLASYSAKKLSMDELSFNHGRSKSTHTRGEVWKEGFDFNGMFHYCPPQKLNGVVLDHDSAMSLQLQNHVVLCLLADENSPLTGLGNFMMPLRTSNVPTDKLKPIVILGNVEYIKKEWSSLSNFPKLYIYPGSPSHRPDLRAVNVEKCTMCVILSAKSIIQVDGTSLDKELILTNLNMQGMFGEQVEHKIKSLGIKVSEKDFHHVDAFREIPISTELEIDQNVAFLEQDDDDDPDQPLYMTQPIANGTTFAASCLDSLLSAAYVDSRILTLVRGLVTGGETLEFEQVLAEGLGIVRKKTETEHVLDKERCLLDQMPLTQPPLQNLKVNQHYGSLVVRALREHGILCIGIFRLMNPDGRYQPYRKRYVITNPPFDFTLLESDLVYVLRPSNLEFTDTNSNLANITSSYDEKGPTRLSRKSPAPSYSPLAAGSSSTKM